MAWWAVGSVWGQTATAGRASGKWPRLRSCGKSFFEIVFSGGWVGITIMVFLIALSITAVYLIIDHLSDDSPQGYHAGGAEQSRARTAGSGTTR